MIIRKATTRQLREGEPIRHADAHKRPVTRRDFLAQGFLAGSATVVAPTIFSLDPELMALMTFSGTASSPISALPEATSGTTGEFGPPGPQHRRRVRSGQRGDGRTPRTCPDYRHTLRHWT